MSLYMQLKRFVVSIASLGVLAGIVAVNAHSNADEKRLTIENVPVLIVVEVAPVAVARAPWRHMLPATIGSRRG